MKEEIKTKNDIVNLLDGFVYEVRCATKDNDECVSSYSSYQEAQRHLQALKEEHDNLVEKWFTTTEDYSNRYHKTNRAFCIHRTYYTISKKVLTSFNDYSA